MSQKIIPDLWRFSSIARFDPKNSRDLIKLDPTLGKGLCVFIPMYSKIDYGFIAEYNDRLIICFRGTRKDIRAYISDIDTYPLLKDGYWGKGTIHNGFYSGWESFKRGITNYISELYKHTKMPIYCCGHSRGGALATLCARHIAKNMKIPCSCLPSGSPKVGIKAFRDQFDLLPINCTRVVNGYDIVPELPPYDFGFRHIGKLHWLKQPRWHKYFRYFSDHHYESYQKEINKI